MSYLDDLQSSWNRFGQSDPLWAIAGDRSKRGNKWQIDDFFRNGAREIEALMRYLASLDITLSRQKALDFGCGIGRLSQALATHFDTVVGIDIAPSMIELANKYNQHGDRCSYFLNSSDDLSLFDDEEFDFIYTSYVLQHIKPEYTRKYIAEFVRVLAPGGVLVFLLPGEANNLRGRFFITVYCPLIDAYHRIKKDPVMEAHFVKRKDTIQSLNDQGVILVDVTRLTEHKYWHNFRYCVIKS